MSRWQQVPLGKLVERVQTWSPADDAPDRVFRYIDLSAVDQETKTITAARAILGADAPSRARQLARQGDVLVSTVRPNLNAIARVSGDLDGATASTGFCVLRPNTSVLDGGYLFHWVRTNTFVADMSRKATGASYPAVSDSVVRGSTLPLPPLSEQRRIAAILDQADELRTKRRAALAALDGLAQAVFVEMFGDPISLGSKWNVLELGSVLDYLTSGSRGWAAHYAESGDLFLRIQNVGHDELRMDDVAFVKAPDTAEARRTKVASGDVLLSITADLGRTAVVPVGLGPAFINQHLAIVRTRAFVPRFLSAYLSSPSGQSQVLSKNRQGVKAGLNFDDIRSLRIPCPPISRQQEFSLRMDSLAAFALQQRRSTTSLDALFASIQYRAFAGEL